jgi:cell division protein FtsZ
MAELARRLKSVGAPQAHASRAHHGAPQAPQARPDPIPAYALEGLEQELVAPLTQTAQQRPVAQNGAHAQRSAPAQASASGEPQIRIGPFRPDPSLIATRHPESDLEHARANEAARSAASERFIPPAAERPEEVQARMPRVEDFPPVVQRQLKRKAPPENREEEERKPRGLLARLASGLARGAEELRGDAPRPRAQNRPTPDIEPRAPAASPHAATQAEFTKQAQPRRMGEPAAATGTLDARGRAAPPEPARDDHLEIPAFLRRQVS